MLAFIYKFDHESTSVEGNSIDGVPAPYHFPLSCLLMLKFGQSCLNMIYPHPSQSYPVESAQSSPCQSCISSSSENFLSPSFDFLWFFCGIGRSNWAKGRDPSGSWVQHPNPAVPSAPRHSRWNILVHFRVLSGPTLLWAAKGVLYRHVGGTETHRAHPHRAVQSINILPTSKTCFPFIVSFSPLRTIQKVHYYILALFFIANCTY